MDHARAELDKLVLLKTYGARIFLLIFKNTKYWDFDYPDFLSGYTVSALKFALEFLTVSLLYQRYYCYRHKL